MLPISVSDIIKLLDQLPVWKTVSALPKRVETLEARCAELERRLAVAEAAPASAPGQICSTCGVPAMRRMSQKPHPTFGVLGGKLEVWTCTACGEVDERTTKPGR